MSEWGKTGRVWVDRSSDGEYNDVHVLGADSKIGNVDRRYGELGWRVVTWDVNDNRHEARIDSFDGAVMWVLRRARPDVWREERPVVWWVMKWNGEWHASTQDCNPIDLRDFKDALLIATARARDEGARFR